MFEIEYKGANTVVITTKQVTIVTDPKLSIAGLPDVVVKNAVELATEERFALNSPDARLRVEGPGEYGVGDADIRGIAVKRHLDGPTADKVLSTIYRIEFGEVTIAVVGNSIEQLTDEQLEGIGVIDVLVVPVGGGGYTLDATGATRVVKQIDPKVVIPVHYADSGVSYEVAQDGVGVFVHELGVDVSETIDKYKLKNASGLPESLTVVQLTRTK